MAPSSKEEKKKAGRYGLYGIAGEQFARLAEKAGASVRYRAFRNDWRYFDGEVSPGAGSELPAQRGVLARCDVGIVQTWLVKVGYRPMICNPSWYASPIAVLLVSEPSGDMAGEGYADTLEEALFNAVMELPL